MPMARLGRLELPHRLLDYSRFSKPLPYQIRLTTALVSAEHLIGTLSPCETSIVYLLAEFEPLTIANIWWDWEDSNFRTTVMSGQSCL